MVIVADAHEYLLKNYMNFDFIWSSPPCPSHSRIRFSQKNREIYDAVYPDFKLYEEVVLLDNYFEGKYVVENVIPFYEPLIPAKKRGRHLYWTNFNLPRDLGERSEGSGIIGEAKNEVDVLCNFHDYDFYKYKGEQRRDKIARNLVDYEVGKAIFATAMGVIRKSNVKQYSLFGDGM
jgi:DNA (cytosine-5)-methyltransferase 1